MRKVNEEILVKMNDAYNAGYFDGHALKEERNPYNYETQRNLWLRWFRGWMEGRAAVRQLNFENKKVRHEIF